MIPIASYSAEFQCGKVWHPCTVVGVCGDPNDLRFVIIARGPTEYVDTAAEVRRPEPSPEPFG